MANINDNLSYYLVIDNDFENSTEYLHLAMALLDVAVTWSSPTFYDANIRDLLTGEIVTHNGTDYQLFDYKSYLSEIENETDE